jgi:tungstate transport system substrate-binding protein
MKKARFFLLGLLVISFLVFFSCGDKEGRAKEPARLRLATTTSLDNTGLLAVILPPFEEELGVKVDYVSVGTGKALKLGENGDVDLVIVHAPVAEMEFIRNGFGVNRRKVMRNDFIILGPKENPAGVEGRDAVAALKTIYQKKATFVSRGDESGTHKKEISLWEKTGIKPKGGWYLEAGQGMGTTLLMAEEKKAYTLCDRGTYLAYQDKISLVILSEGDPKLINRYSVIAVNPCLHPEVNYVYAMAFIGWLTSPACQRMVGDFKVKGEILFHPTACEK